MVAQPQAYRQAKIILTFSLTDLQASVKVATMMSETNNAVTADKINAHLTAGGVVQVTTYLHATLYKQKHAGWFFERDGALYVRSGRSSVKLSAPKVGLLVGIRFGRIA